MIVAYLKRFPVKYLYLLLFILVLYGAVAFRLNYVSKHPERFPLYNNHPEISFPKISGDAQDYANLAETMLKHKAFLRPEILLPETLRTPGYPVFLAVVLGIFHSWWLIIFLQTLMVWAAACIVWRIGEKLRLGKASIIPPLLFVIDPTMLLYTLIIVTEPLFLLLFFSSVYLAFFVKTATWKKFLLSGILLAIAGLVRPIAIYFPLVYAVALFVAYYKTLPLKRIGYAFLLITVPVILTVAGWAIRNKVQTGYLAYSTISDINLYLYNIADYKASRNGKTLSEMQYAHLDEIGSSHNNFDFTDMAPKLNERSVEVLKKEWLSYGFFHVRKASASFFVSGLGFFLQYCQCPTYARPDRTAGLPDLLAAGKIGELLRIATQESPLFLERIFWFVVFLASVAAVFIKRYRWTFLLFWLFTLWFLFLTGPVPTSRYRPTFSPFMFIMTVVLVQYLYAKFKNKKAKV